MIVTTDIGNILYRDCKIFGIKEIYQKGNIPDGEITTERIIIRTKNQSPDTYWKKGFVEVNLCVPDVDISSADLIRLGELERQAIKHLGDVVGSYDGSTYHYSIDSTGVEADTSLKCHYVNVRILFEVLNVK
jgi:hypothetical protein|nr:MAG TPA: hypothetical protein [Caudoviricetes sp.]